jgi:hypothetical protein
MPCALPALPFRLFVFIVASCFIPFFLDGKATCPYRGRSYIDGSLWDFLLSDNSDLVKCDGEACVVDYVSNGPGQQHTCKEQRLCLAAMGCRGACLCFALHSCPAAPNARTMHVLPACNQQALLRT